MTATASRLRCEALIGGRTVPAAVRYGFEEEAKQGRGDAAARIAEKAAALPLFVASDAACFTTGASLNLKGGEVTFF